MTGRPRVLVIKLGALGDFVQALGPMAAIRRHHADAEITLLTTKPYQAFAAACPSIDRVWIDQRPSLINLPGVLRLRHLLRRERFTLVYDLQTSDRSGFYYRLMGRPDWSGIAAGCSRPHANPARDLMHTLDRQTEQLAMAGVAPVGPADLSWARPDLGRFDLPPRFAALVPGGSAHRPAKRWPVERFIALARHLGENGLPTIIIGGPIERPIGAAITAAEPRTQDLTGRTDFLEIAAIGARAAHAIGNDTGPMHLLAAAGAPATVLFSAESDPALTAPRGRAVTILRRASLADLSVAEVAASVKLG
jgi:ADP-heptose:LPS heptosyltransferase